MRGVVVVVVVVVVRVSASNSSSEEEEGEDGEGKRLSSPLGVSALSFPNIDRFSSAVAPTLHRSVIFSFRSGLSDFDLTMRLRGSDGVLVLDVMPLAALLLLLLVEGCTTSPLRLNS